MGGYAVTVNIGGTPYISTRNVQVNDTEVNFGLGLRRISPVGKFIVNINNPIPTDTTGTLPVKLTLNGITRALTFFNGVPVTAADLQGTGVIEVFNDHFHGILQILSISSSSATTNSGN